MELHNLKTFINNFRQLLEHDVFLIPSVGIVSLCSMFFHSPFWAQCHHKISLEWSLYLPMTALDIVCFTRVNWHLWRVVVSFFSKYQPWEEGGKTISERIECLKARSESKLGKFTEREPWKIIRSEDTELKESRIKKFYVILISWKKSQKQRNKRGGNLWYNFMFVSTCPLIFDGLCHCTKIEYKRSSVPSVNS